MIVDKTIQWLQSYVSWLYSYGPWPLRVINGHITPITQVIDGDRPFTINAHTILQRFWPGLCGEE